MTDIVTTDKETVLYKLNIEKEIYLRSQLEKWIWDARKNISSACERTRFSNFSYLCYQLLFHHGKNLIEGWQQGIIDLNQPEERFFVLPKFKKQSQNYLSRVMDEIGIIAYLGGRIHLSGFERKSQDSFSTFP